MRLKQKVSSSVFSVLLSSIWIHLAQCSPWTQPSLPTIPDGGLYTANNGVYNNEAWLIGGVNAHTTKVKSYNFSNDVYTTHADITPGGTQSWGKSYAQYQDTLHILTPSPITTPYWISTYNMDTNAFTTSAYAYAPPDSTHTVDQSPCLTVYNALLFVLGGYREVGGVGDTDYFTIYDIGQSQWEANGPSLPFKVVSGSCDVIGDMLYLIGGEDPTFVSNMIHYLDVSAVYTSSWQLFPYNLTVARKHFRTVVFEDRDIYVVGGMTNRWVDPFNIITSVEVVNVATQTVTMYNDLVTGVARFSLFLDGNVIYAIGGVLNNDNDASDKYQYSIINAPTKNPTFNPTMNPSFNPSFNPTFHPTTTNPTMTPTFDPTTDPTTKPSYDPTSSPSVAPSFSPTTAPTTCYDLDSIFSNDGAEYNIYDKLLDLRFINIVQNASRISIIDNGFSKALTLIDDNKQELRCNADYSCLYSNMLIQNNVISNILCNGAFSCAATTINVKDSTNTHIICNATHSCSDMSIYADSRNSNVTIECGVIGSCMDLKIDIVGNDNHAQINCIDVNSCDGLNAATDATNYKNVKLNMFSHSNNVTFSNGFGFEESNSSTQYVECNTNNKWVRWNTSWNSPNHDIILSAYINNEFPCNGLTIECFENNFTDIVSSCSLQYDIIPFNITAQSTRDLADCYWVELKDIVSIFCDGDCVSSPTDDPTTAPTASPTDPTKDPTNDPTMQPTMHPTINPTTNPTLIPTTDPTKQPTFNPTSDPTTQPTLHPTTVPTIDPTKDPTTDPTTEPTVDPTIDPTRNPTYSPSVAPSRAPSTPPTGAPSAPPTNAPTESPSIAPSNPPTRNPSNNPTYSPSAAPSRVPTRDVEDIYDTYIITQYSVLQLTVANKEFIVSNVVEVVGKLEEIIESNYYADEILEYTNFFVNILTINGKNVDTNDASANAAGDSDSTALTVYDLDINNIEDKPMTLECRIECALTDSEFMITKTDTPSFETGTQKGFMHYFNNTDIAFVVEYVGDALAKHVVEYVEPASQIALVLSVIIVSIGLFFSLIAFVYNKLKFTKIDNAVFFMPFLISLNLYDFLSDVNLAVVVITTATEPKYASYTSLMFWLAVLSVVFILLPFSSNLLYAMRIRRQRAIKDNPSARAYFGAHLAQFILLCVFCAGTYPVLGLTSSRLFGLDIFNAGLLSSELHELSKIKIRSTIYMENLPQLMIQVLFYVSTAQDDVDKNATILAFVASLLSVVASVIIYQAQRDSSEEFLVEKYFIQLYHASGITDDDADNIKFCKGLKQKLRDHLCQVFNISNKSIEIGFVTLNDYGLIVHLQHQIYKEELDTLKNKLLSDQNFAIPTAGYVIDITPDMYIERLFELHRVKILNALAQHFKMGDRKTEFEVLYHRRIQDANDYDDMANDVEGEDLLSAFKEKITDISLNPYRSTAMRSVNIDSELMEEKEMMTEMSKIPTSTMSPGANNADWGKSFENMNREMMQMKVQNQQMQMQMKEQQRELKEMLLQVLMQRDNDGKATVTNDDIQLRLQKTMSTEL